MYEIPGYRIQRRIAAGAQGEVFLAHDAAGTPVALKIVRHDALDGEADAPARLAREARLLRAVDSPHVVRVLDFRVLPDCSCLVMELLDGPTLQQAVRQRCGSWLPPAADSGNESATRIVPATEQQLLLGNIRRPSDVPVGLRSPEHAAWVLQIALQVGRGVAHLHQLGQVHRDLKPGNVILAEAGERAVVADFGLARAPHVTTVTQADALVGTLSFMAPELLAGSAAGTRSDVFALGATLFHCLCGAPPGGGAADRRPATPAGAGRRLRRLNPAVPMSLAAVVDRALEPDPRDRYPDAVAMLADLERAARGEAVRPPFSAGRLWRHHRRNLGIALAAAGLTALAVLILGRGAGQATAARMLAAARAGDHAAVAHEWAQLEDAGRAAVRTALERDLPAEAGPLHTLALGTGLAPVLLAPTVDWVATLQPTDTDEFTTAPPLAEFTDLTRGLARLLDPGLCWLLLVPRDRQRWWAPDDPLCHPLLRRLRTPEADATTAAETPWLALVGGPGQPLARGGTGFWVRIAAGRHRVGVGRAVNDVELLQDFAVARLELPAIAARHFLGNLRNAPDGRFAALRHPDEPADFVATLSAMQPPAAADDWLPAQVSFWLAWRLAAFHGCVIPGRTWWRIAAQDGIGHRYPAGREFAPEEAWRRAPVAVDSEPGKDCTGWGLHFMLGNVLEWTVATPSLARGMRAAMPGAGQRPGLPQAFLDLWQCDAEAGGLSEVFGVAAGAAAGVRLFRVRITP